MTPTIVDIHPHIISDDEVRYPKFPLGGVPSDWSLKRPVTWPQLDAAMRTAGIDKAAVVQASTVYAHDNSYLADVVDGEKGRIVGVASIGLADDDVIWQIDHWVRERGLSGVRAFVTGSTTKKALRVNDDRAAAAWAELARLKVPVAMNLDSESIPDLLDVLGRHDGLTVVLDHAARTDFADGPPYLAGRPVAEFTDFPGVHLKLTTRTLEQAKASAGGPRGLLRELVDRFGSARLAWGSNFPATAGNLSDMTTLLSFAVADLSDDERADVCGRTAMRLYPDLAGGSQVAAGADREEA